MQRLVAMMPAIERRDILRRRGDFEHQTQLVRADFLDRLERPHGAVLAVDANVEHVLVGRARGRRRPCSTRACDPRLQARSPVVDLADDERIAHRADQDALIAGLLGAFELNRVALGLE